jgi:hypothetical protein
MAKTCNAEGCYRPRWGGGFCSYHQRLMEDKKPKKIAPRTSKEKVHEISFGFDDQLSMFQALWEQAQDEKGIVTCPYTKERLNQFYNTEMWFSCFAHVLPKGRYTYWKLNPDNIRIVHPNFHKCVDQGTTEIRKQWTGWKFAEWDALVIEMKEKYAQFKKQNLLA